MNMASNLIKSAAIQAGKLPALSSGAISAFAGKCPVKPQSASTNTQKNNNANQSSDIEKIKDNVLKENPAVLNELMSARNKVLEDNPQAKEALKIANNQPTDHEKSQPHFGSSSLNISFVQEVSVKQSYHYSETSLPQGGAYAPSQSQPIEVPREGTNSEYSGLNSANKVLSMLKEARERQMQAFNGNSQQSEPSRLMIVPQEDADQEDADQEASKKTPEELIKQKNFEDQVLKASHPAVLKEMKKEEARVLENHPEILKKIKEQMNLQKA